MPHLCARLLRGATLIVFALALAACHLGPLAEAREEWRRQYTLSGDGLVELRETNGTFEITASENDTVEVIATKIGKGVDEAAAKQVLSRIEIREDAQPGRLVLDSTGDRQFGFRESKQVNYVVRMPRQASVTIRSTNGAVSVTGIAGRVTVETTNGEIKARGLASDTTVSATNGAVALDFARVGGAVRCETTNGEIELTLPRDANAELSARLTNGAIEHDNLPLKMKENSRRRLDATIGAGGPEIRLETVNGAITVRGR
jgi:hypothetical protein